MWRRLLLPPFSRWTLLWRIHGHSSASASASATAHGLDVGPVLERLRKVADVAGYVFIAVHGQRDDGNEAEGEPRMALDDAPAVVAAVVASAHDALVALDFLAEGVFTAREHNTHICLPSSLVASRRFSSAVHGLFVGDASLMGRLLSSLSG